MESWDDDSFVPQKVTTPAKGASVNKWEGEDEDDDVKESWEDEDEEKEKEKEKEREEAALKAVPKSKKKSPTEIQAEKERLKQEELLRKQKEAEDYEDLPEAEKLKRQKESDLKLALETTFGDVPEGDSIDIPSSVAELEEFVNSFTKKIQPIAKSSEYPLFAENLIRNICVTLSSFDLKKIKTTIDNMYLEKQKIEKGEKTKKNKGKGKVKLKVEDSNQYSAYAVDDYDDFNDFM